MEDTAEKNNLDRIYKISRIFFATKTQRHQRL